MHRNAYRKEQGLKKKVCRHNNAIEVPTRL
jgi:hypothetical protein